MNANDLKIGGTYLIRKKDWEAPTGEICEGYELIREILEPANSDNSAFDDGPAPAHVIKEWQQFLRVRDPASGKIHFLHPDTIESAVLQQI